MWKGVGDRTELQHINPHSIGHNRVSFLFSWAAQQGAWSPASLGHVPQSSILSLTPLIPSCNCLIGGLRALSAGYYLSLSHLLSNSSDLQTNCLPDFTELYNSSTYTFFLWASQIALIRPSTVKATLCYSLTRCTCYLHRCISNFDSPVGS